MTETTPAATAAPPKKRSFFKKAAWQTKVKPEGEKDQDIFSHSNEFKDIVAEQTRRKQEEKRIKLEEKRKQEESRERKRRRISDEAEDLKPSRSGSGSSPRSDRKESKARSRTPLSPPPTQPPANSLSARYESLTRSSSSTGVTDSFIEKASKVIDLGDSDSDPEDAPYKARKWEVAQRPSKPAPVEDDDVEEMEDPVLAALAAQARARAAKKAQSSEATRSGTPVADVKHDTIVQLLITSEIPDTTPLLVKVKTSSTLEKCRTAWCQKQRFPPERTKHVFLTWKHNKLFDSTTIMRLGIKIDTNGVVSMDGDSNIYSEDNLPKIHLEAWTEDIFKQWQREQADEAAAKKKAEGAPLVEEPPPVQEAPPERKVRLIVKTRGKPDFKITVKNETTIEHLTSAYKQKLGLPDNEPVTLMFDGERLRPMDTIGDTEIEDMDSLEAHSK